MIKRIIHITNIMDLFFPQVCGICGRLHHEGICPKCSIKLKKLAENSICHQDLENMYFDELIYIFKYEGLIRKIILDYKFHEKSYIYVCLVNFILKNKKIFQKLQTYDIIIPVPISKKRMKERGYNQSLLIAKKISKDVKISLQTNCLRKTKHITEQSKLNKEQRKQNIQNVYELKNGEILNNKRILLIDDIYTTGSTVNECCKMLQKAMPKKIGVFTIAKD